jgi:hypothetical protein
MHPPPSSEQERTPRRTILSCSSSGISNGYLALRIASFNPIPLSELVTNFTSSVPPELSRTRNGPESTPRCKPRGFTTAPINRNLNENNHLYKSAGSLERHCGRFCGFDFLKKPSVSTTTGCNSLILREDFWVEYLVPNKIQPILPSLLKSMTPISLKGNEMRPSMLELVEACEAGVLSPTQNRLQVSGVTGGLPPRWRTCCNLSNQNA